MWLSGLSSAKGAANMYYRNFFLIVAVQLAWYFLICLINRSGLGTAGRHLLFGMVCGVPVGLLFDLVFCDIAGVFEYPAYMGWRFLVINGLFSYGLSTATVFVCAGLVLSRTGGNRNATLYLHVVIALLCSCLALLSSSSIIIVFSAGACILFTCEAILALLHANGAINALQHSHMKPFGRFWALSVATGLVYESANLLYPVWAWSPFIVTPCITTGVIVVFGYFVLLYPALALSRACDLFNNLFNGGRGL